MNRRGLLFGVGAFLLAPAIVRVSNLMPISTAALDVPFSPILIDAVSLERVIFDEEGRAIVTKSAHWRNVEDAPPALQRRVRATQNGWGVETGGLPDNGPLNHSDEAIERWRDECERLQREAKNQRWDDEYWLSQQRLV